MPSMLAAVRAAALGSTSSAALATAQHQQEKEIKQMTNAATAEMATPATPAVVSYSQEQMNAAVAAARADGAIAERARILGIEVVAMAGHEQLVADMKADGVTTPEQAAMRLIHAEKAKGAARLTALKDVEHIARDVRPAPSASVASARSGANTPDGWTEEYAASDDLRAEFGSAEAYVAYKRGLASGNIRILTKRAG